MGECSGARRRARRGRADDGGAGRSRRAGRRRRRRATTWCSSPASCRCSRAATAPRSSPAWAFPRRPPWSNRSVVGPAVLDALRRGRSRDPGDRRRRGRGEWCRGALVSRAVTASHSTPVARVLRSLPVRARGADGVVHDYDDPRLVRERGMRPALADAGIGRKAAAAVGLPAKDAAALCEGDAPRVLTTGASAPVFALAALAETRTVGLLLAFEQATMTAVEVSSGAVTVTRVERPAQDLPRAAHHAGAGDPDLAAGVRARVRRQGAARGRAVCSLRHAGAAAALSLPGLRRRRRRRAHRAPTRRDRVHHDDHPHPGARTRHAVHDRDRRARRDRACDCSPGSPARRRERRHRRPR